MFVELLLDEDDDEFLYGTSSTPKIAAPGEVLVGLFSTEGGNSYCRFTRFYSPQSPNRDQPVENSLLDSRGIVSQLEAVVAASAAAAKQNAELAQSTNVIIPHFEADTQEDAQGGDADEGDGDVGDSEEEEDIEIIMEPTARSLDFRQQRPQQQRTPSTSIPPRAPQPSLTTEYTPIQRIESSSTIGTSSSLSQMQPPSMQSAHLMVSQSASAQAPTFANNLNVSLDNGADPATLPAVTAPPSHPEIDPTAPGMLDGRAIFEVDIAAMSDKPWRRAGSDIGDWFNYGFDELSWEAYCYRRRELGEMADALKVNVLNFAAMPEEQLTALPSDIRQMVMTGATAAMMNNTPNPGMMAPGVMMDMSMMNMGMNGDMGMNQQMMPVDQRAMMMQDGVPPQGPMGATGTPEQGGGGGMPVGMMQDGFPPGGPMGMGIPGDYSMQDQSQMFPGPGMDPQGPQNIQNVPPVPTPRGPTPSYRARGNIGPGMRSRGFPGRGRGRGGMYVSEGAPVVARPASPLPPNVPTGPRNQNKYKDRDGNAPAVDGLDYGGDRVSTRTPSGEPEERASTRKRRGSPSMDDGRGPKRR
ncbi:hypothetical protein J3R30DRAFT_3696968 [Lentinula aciculospora]|uniref:Pre-mRNA polyadenylation factor Fip1 domain-containing protein n=1 Tax=Lentinula aciculospora TaxID=153920 RepID=A0A9W9ALJ2_9AGAR|nr:hypothetical protein J3R30DRAFT_3696968 [Lentinula aciculospora]